MLKIYNTLTNKKEDFVPINHRAVRMYVCGPTTYDYFHIGNGRAFLFFDVVRRYFQYKGFKVLYVQNLTDIDDKIIQKAKEEKTDIDKIASKYIRAFQEDIKGLGIKRASIQPKATDYIHHMIKFIKRLEHKGFTYSKTGDVYFSVGKVKDYGKLSGKNIDQLKAGARVIADMNKEFAGDFVLWKKAKPGEPQWDSPWGKGRPGWHTECVVMAKDILDKENYSRRDDSSNPAELFDIHAGGVDLIFPHHENEIAQARADSNSQLANYWIHNGFINIEGEKMSKSLGNFFTVRDILKKYQAETIRHYYLSKHYRSSIDFNTEILRDSQNAYNKLLQPLKEYYRDKGTFPQKLKCERLFKEEFCLAMDDDFNTARALAVLFELGKEIHKSNTSKDLLVYTLLKLGKVVGFFRNISAHIKEAKQDVYTEKLINMLITYRNEFKQERKWIYADMIRDDLAKAGIVLQDTHEGTKWYFKDS